MKHVRAKVLLCVHTGEEISTAHLKTLPNP